MENLQWLYLSGSNTGLRNYNDRILYKINNTPAAHIFTSKSIAELQEILADNLGVKTGINVSGEINVNVAFTTLTSVGSNVSKTVSEDLTLSITSLPEHFTELIIERLNKKDDTLKQFFAIFNQRIMPSF